MQVLSTCEQNTNLHNWSGEQRYYEELYNFELYASSLQTANKNVDM
jgi:hypothetical protein